MCGPSVDPALLDVNEMLRALREQGTNVQRHQMSSDLQAFLQNRDVYRLIQEQKMAALPIAVVNGRVIKVGAYPSVSEINAALKEGNR
jgi:predicted NAD/FAD-binding protein